MLEGKIQRTASGKLLFAQSNGGQFMCYEKDIIAVRDLGEDSAGVMKTCIYLRGWADETFVVASSAEDLFKILGTEIHRKHPFREFDPRPSKAEK